MPRKVVSVYIPKNLVPLLEKLAESLGLADSEVLLHCFLAYAKEVSLITEKVHSP